MRADGGIVDGNQGNVFNIPLFQIGQNFFCDFGTGREQHFVANHNRVEQIFANQGICGHAEFFGRGHNFGQTFCIQTVALGRQNFLVLGVNNIVIQAIFIQPFECGGFTNPQFAVKGQRDTLIKRGQDFSFTHPADGCLARVGQPFLFIFGRRQTTQQHRCRDFAATVDADIDNALGFFEINPAAMFGDDTRCIRNRVPGDLGFFGRTEHNTLGAVHLGNDNTFDARCDKAAAFSHQRHFAHKYFLFLDIAQRLLTIFCDIP